MTSLRPHTNFRRFALLVSTPFRTVAWRLPTPLRPTRRRCPPCPLSTRSTRAICRADRISDGGGISPDVAVKKNSKRLDLISLHISNISYSEWKSYRYEAPMSRTEVLFTTRMLGISTFSPTPPFVPCECHPGYHLILILDSLSCGCRVFLETTRSPNYVWSWINKRHVMTMKRTSTVLR